MTTPHTFAEALSRAPVEDADALRRRPEPPAALDDEGRRLWEEAEARSEADSVDFFIALTRVTGRPEYGREEGMLAIDLEGLADDESVEVDRDARALMPRYGVGYVDAAELVDVARKLEERRRETGASEVPWRDTRPLNECPIPWSEDHWERDRRRAAVAGIDLTREEWQAAAEEGRDFVGEQAEAGRRERVRTLEQELAASLAGAQAREHTRRTEAIERELRQRALERLGHSGTSSPRA